MKVLNNNERTILWTVSVVSNKLGGDFEVLKFDSNNVRIGL